MPEQADTGFTARCLLRAARQGSLATLADGAPFASLVTPAMSCGGTLLILVSGLSRHGRHLRQDGRCALLLNGADKAANPQTTPRLTITGSAEPEPDQALRDRWLRIHPYGALYAGFADFTLWRLQPLQAYFVAGFGQVKTISGQALQPPCDIAADEAGLCAAANARHHAALPDGSRIIALDADGLDLGPGPSLDPDGESRTRRISFPAAALTTDSVLNAVESIFSMTA